MKLCFVAPFGIRPKGTVLARMIPLAAALQARGHQVIIVAPPYTNPEDSGRVETVQGVELRNIVLAPGGKALATPLMTWRMYRAVQAVRPDLIHLFKPKGYGGLAAMLHLLAPRLQRRGRTPLCVDTDDWEGSGGMNDLQAYGHLERRVYRFQEQWLSRRASGVTVASRCLYRLTHQLGVPEQRLLYLPNGVQQNHAEGNRVTIRKQLGIAENQPVLLLYTRFFEFAQPPLYRLFQALVQNMPLLKILVVGQGRHGEQQLLEQAATAMGFGDALQCAGWVEPDQLPDWLAAADVALYPFDDTLTNRTKCPAKLTELLLAGLPVVAHRVGQIAEYLALAGDELLCAPGDWDQMQEQLLRLLRDKEQAVQLGQRLKSDIVRRYCWSDAAVQLERFYQDCCRQ